ncbi:MAG: hypothetical protein COX80_03605 [Candidatus Magasanikbacteria bacterium CG_4_10_14_0_2_um_filter_33_14]|uniref:Uncharacterized protein n=1 Tax=Candidatus Magasanikbacteria bacterium CG_4_10_14_0_2_um_filter_33_14 TaxID=1974636 RepID=A0A2M7VA65_9BACT|nr:MAG: hypothetical protein COX80_03605 [Candidatus Magasanikbacteria bacterium CG_4_10_14_0_2_um_filter_33_14]
MNNKKFFLTFGFLTGFFLLVMMFAPGFAFADNYGLDATAGAAGLPSGVDLPTVLGNVIGTALSMISVLFFGLMLYGGIMWMTARGKSENTQKALDTIIAAIIGVVIVLAAYAITNFVFSNVQSGAGGAGGGTGGTGGNNTPPVSQSCVIGNTEVSSFCSTACNVVQDACTGNDYCQDFCKPNDTGLLCIPMASQSSLCSVYSNVIANCTAVESDTELCKVQ